MSFSMSVLLVISLLLGIPYIVYVVVKVGTFAFYQGQYQFFNQKKENERDGNKKN